MASDHDLLRTYVQRRDAEALLRAMVEHGVDPAAANADGAGLIERVRSAAIIHDLTPTVARVLQKLGLEHPWLAALRISNEVRGPVGPDRQPLLLAEHPELQAGPIGAYDETLLHLAVEYRNHGLAAYLLEHAGAEVDATTRGTAETPLHWAVGRTRDPELIALLLEHGADPTRVASYGKSPLDQTRDADFTWAVAAMEAVGPQAEDGPGADDF